MKNLFRLLYFYVTVIIIFALGKSIFILTNLTAFNDTTFGEVLRVFPNGWSMDLSMAGYLSVMPGLFLSLLNLFNKKYLLILIKIWTAITSVVLTTVILLDSILYSYWQFKLDATPVFYFFSSPRSAMASAGVWQITGAILCWILLSFLIYKVLEWVLFKVPTPGGRKQTRDWRGFCLTLFCTLLLFIPIRGGVTVSTMNLSRAYFSNKTILNHAAVNPMFSLMYSLTHQDNFASQFRYLDDDEATRLFGQMTRHENGCDSTVLLKDKRPDIYFIILESFSSHLFPSLGGESVALKLDSVARDGLLFTGVYASSFRTDRGLPAILSAYPGQPNTSIMKFVDKTENLPSLAGTLKTDAGYRCEYYYGGDANFTNMLAYLVSSGYDKIISDRDFPVSKRLSKWGAHDDELFRRTLDEISKDTVPGPVFRVIQTSSSHEPFEVPYEDRGRFEDKRARAFAYTDSCASAFINDLRHSGKWDNSLVVLVPDHYGAYPDLTDPISRHRIPIIMTGGALNTKGKINTVASQSDIIATLLDEMDLDRSQFEFSHNILNPCEPHYAFFADPSYIGLIVDRATSMTDNEMPGGYVVYNIDSNTVQEGDAGLVPYAQSYLQKIYDDLSKR